MDIEYIFKNYSSVIDKPLRTTLENYMFSESELVIIERQLRAKCFDEAIEEDKRREAKKAGVKCS